MRTMWTAQNLSKGLVFFADNEAHARVARVIIPELRRSRVVNVLQVYPSRVKIGKLYQHGEEVNR